MTRQEFVECVTRDIMEEAGDYEKYKMLAVIAKDVIPEQANVFEQIAGEEYKHHEALVKILSNMAAKAGEVK